MRWTQAFNVPETSLDFGGDGAAGAANTAALERLPLGGDWPRPNERWILQRLYLPFGVGADWHTATLGTTASVLLTLTQAGIVVWSEADTLTLTEIGSGGVTSFANGLVSDDFQNPIYFYSGASPLILSMTLSVNASTNTFHMLIGGQYTTDGLSLMIQPSPGSITYSGISLDDSQFDQVF